MNNTNELSLLFTLINQIGIMEIACLYTTMSAGFTIIIIIIYSHKTSFFKSYTGKV